MYKACYTKLVSLLLFLFAGIIMPGVGTGQEPGPMASPIDMKHIVLDLKFDWEKKQAYGTARLTLSLLKNTGTITLDAADLVIREVKLDNGTRLQYTCDEKKEQLIIALDRQYKQGEDITCSISYRSRWVNATDPGSIWGSTGKGIRFFGPSATEPNRRKQMWSMGEGGGNRYWYPCHEAPGDLRTTEFIGTVEAGLTLISNGSLISERKNADGSHTFHYKMNIPYPNRKTAFVIGAYVDVQQQAGNTTLHNYVYQEEQAAAIATIDRLPDMVRYCSEITGQPYPYPEYKQAFVQELPWGYSAAGLAVQTENMIDDHPTHADFLYLWDMLEGEALAGQWFGNYISCNSWEDYWLDKAFSRYFSCLYNEYKNGKEEFLLYQLTFDQGNYFADWNAGNRQPVVPDKVTDITGFINGNYPNSRGALVLHMLRKQLGEDKWRKAIRLYVQANAGRAATTNDFQKAVSLAAGENMDWFFDQWLHQMGHPIFELSKIYDKERHKLILTVRQVQEADTSSNYRQTAFFKGKMQVAIDNRIEEVWIAPQLENTFSFFCPQQPGLVGFDYESTWIKEVRFERSLEELLYQLQEDKDILGKRWAMTALVSLSADKNTTDKDKQRIYAGFRQLIRSRNYWRIRYNAMLSLQGMLSHGEEPLLLDEATTQMLLAVMEKDTAWLRTAAIAFLGKTGMVKYADLYTRYFSDKSERVVNAAAIALGKTKSPQAFDALVRLKNKPSWKNQSLISMLNGLKELGDQRGIAFALQYINASHLPHWTLTTSLWDHRLAAAETLLRLRATDKAVTMIRADLNKAVQEDNNNDIFYNLLQLTLLANPAGQDAFDSLKIKYKDNAAAINAVVALEQQFQASVQTK